MQAPAREPSDSCMALRAYSTLFIPEIAKSAGTPKRFQLAIFQYEKHQPRDVAASEAQTML
jgi:hypothetical protein